MRLTTLYSAILITLLLITCVFDGDVRNKCYSYSRPGVTPIDFVSDAQDMLKERFPEWFVEETKIFIRQSQRGKVFARVRPQRFEGELIMDLYPISLRLCTVEDLASVLLHEYVHVKVWDELQERISDEDCRNARHELIANFTVLDAREKLPYSDDLLGGALVLYETYYAFAECVCEPEVYEDYPRPSIPGLTAPEAP